ncbi:AAA family ATPase [Isoptericola sp. NEAU-Y5]|uniref:AAA family ATPase n=1 Tax=Isoptericola luteus TaxID=2879484 RepID=A0ABS7ZJA2_9MICO|nr:AAA family ATPase [Isoptericola sp. NEAU-Y5]MCA5895110.1 AAA family ATPase [Isoptericola sp. NEAU-Y5]
MPEPEERSFRLYGAPRAQQRKLGRERLLDRLDADAALRVVRGPSGSGKTALLAEWARRRDATGVWFTAPPSTSRAELWRAIAQRAARATLDHVTTKPLPDHADTDDLFEWLAEAALSTRREVLVVIDDYHQVTEAEVHADVLNLLRSCPNLSIAVATRVASPLEAPAIGLELERTVITAEQLPLTPDETAAVLRNAGLDLDPADAYVRTGGQPLYLRVAMLAAEMAGSHGTPGHVQVADELLRTAVDKQLEGPSRAQLEQLLLRCAVPEVLTGELAVSLTRTPAAIELLSMLEERGLGTWERRPVGRVFVLFPVVRSLVLDTARLELADEIARIEEATARWYMANGYPVQALRHAINAGALDVASAVVGRYWVELIEPRPLDQLTALKRVSRADLRRWPLLSGALAIHLDSVPGGRDEAIDLYRLTLATLRPRVRATGIGERLVLEVLESVALRSTGANKRALAPARLARRTIDELDVHEHRRLIPEIPRLRAEVALSLARGGEADEALAVLEDLGDSPTENPRTLYGLSLRALLRVMRGDMPDAQRDLEIIDASPLEEVHAGRDHDLYRLARAFVCVERFDARAAQAHVDIMRPHLATLETRPMFAYVQSLIDLVSFEAALGSERLRRYVAADRGRQRISTANSEQLAYSAGLLNLARGRVGAVHASLRAASSRSPLTWLQRAHVALLTEHWQSAAEVLVEHLPPPGASPRYRAAHTMLFAAALTRSGQETRARDTLGKLAAITADRELTFVFALPARRELLELAELADRSHDQTAQRVIAAAEPVPELFAAMVDLKQPLTDREVVVLDTLMRHATAAEISQDLTVSVNTVKSQLRSIYRKLGVRRREDALAKGLDLGIIMPEHLDTSGAAR